MRVSTKRLGLSASGGGLIVLGFIAAYSMIKGNPSYILVAIGFLGVGIIALYSAFKGK